MQSSPERVSGGRFPFGPKTTTGYHLPTLRVGLAGRKGGEDLTHSRAGKRGSELDATLVSPEHPLIELAKPDLSGFTSTRPHSAKGPIYVVSLWL